MFGIDVTQYFLDPQKVIWFWILVPLVIMYLIRPRPVNQTIPSLMFLMQDKARAFRNSFLKYIYRDFVFLLQVIILALLVAAAAQPYISVAKTSLVNNAVIVLDASASMQTDDGRWDAAIKLAKNSLARQNTIVLAESRPVIIAKDVSSSDAEKLLSTLKPVDTETNLYAAIIAAKSSAPTADTIVTIISDFRNTDPQQDYHVAVKTLRTTGATVNLHGVGGPAKNVGIVSMDVKDDKTVVGVKNYEAEAVVVNLKAGTLTQSIPLAPGKTDYATFTTPTGTTPVTIDTRDDFDLDNTAIIANSPSNDIKILIVTNNPDIKKTPMWIALQSINDQTTLKLHIDINTPPAIVTVNHDIIIFADVNPSLLVQRTVRETAQQVKNGKGTIIIAQDDMFGINYEGMLPFTYAGPGGASSAARAEFSMLTKDIEFGDVQSYHRVNGTARTLVQATADGSPLIAISQLEKGQVLYYGIQDSKSSFPLEPTYPVFWKRMLSQLTGRIDINSLNVKTGSAAIGITTLPSKVPSNTDYRGFFDKQGVYVFPDRTVAANLLSAEESDVSARPVDDTNDKAAMGTGEDTKTVELAPLVIVAALLLLALELFIVKFRGDF